VDDLRRGDVVIVRSPHSPSDSICKRLVGLPGDRINWGDYGAVPSGQVWLEGDNSSESRDSRLYGPVPLGLVQGKVVCRVWPPDLNAATSFQQRDAVGDGRAAG